MILIWTLLHRQICTYSCDIGGIYMYYCPYHANRPFTSLKTIGASPTGRPEKLSYCWTLGIHKARGMKQPWASFCLCYWGWRKRERYHFVFIQQKTEGSSENLKITAQLKERDVVFDSNMTSNIFPNLFIDCLHPSQLMNEQHLNANILLSHILCVSCSYLTWVLCFGKCTMKMRSVFFYSDKNTTVQASMQR